LYYTEVSTFPYGKLKIIENGDIKKMVKSLNFDNFPDPNFYILWAYEQQKIHLKSQNQHGGEAHLISISLTSISDEMNWKKKDELEKSIEEEELDTEDSKYDVKVYKMSIFDKLEWLKNKGEVNYEEFTVKSTIAKNSKRFKPYMKKFQSEKNGSSQIRALRRSSKITSFSRTLSKTFAGSSGKYNNSSSKKRSGGKDGYTIVESTIPERRRSRINVGGTKNRLKSRKSIKPFRISKEKKVKKRNNLITVETASSKRRMKSCTNIKGHSEKTPVKGYLKRKNQGATKTPPSYVFFNPDEEERKKEAELLSEQIQSQLGIGKKGGPRKSFFLKKKKVRKRRKSRMIQKGGGPGLTSLAVINGAKKKRPVSKMKGKRRQSRILSKTPVRRKSRILGKTPIRRKSRFVSNSTGRSGVFGSNARRRGSKTVNGVSRDKRRQSRMKISTKIDITVKNSTDGGKITVTGQTTTLTSDFSSPSKKVNFERKINFDIRSKKRSKDSSKHSKIQDIYQK